MILRSLSLAAAVAFCAAPAFADTRFFSAIDDLPLAPELTETSSASFANGDGGVITSQANGVGSAVSVRLFYERTLPALGWSESPDGDPNHMGDIVYQRGREQLRLHVQQNGPTISLIVRLIAQPASTRAD